MVQKARLPIIPHLPRLHPPTGINIIEHSLVTIVTIQRYIPDNASVRYQTTDIALLLYEPLGAIDTVWTKGKL